MDRQINRNRSKQLSYEQRVALTKQFHRRLLKLILTSAILCATGLGYLWFWLYRYESRSVNGAMTQYIDNVCNQRWDRVYHDDTRYFTELNSKETIIAYLRGIYADKNASGIVFSYAGSQNEGKTKLYNAYYQNSQISTLEVYKPEKQDRYKVRTVGLYNEYNFELLDPAIKFRINGIPITDDFSYDEDVVVSGFDAVSKNKVLPVVKRYTVTGFITAPNVELEEPNTYTSIRDYSSQSMILGEKPTSQQFSSMAKEIEDTAIAYCKYITKDGSFYDLTKHLYPRTTFYNAISSFSNQWFSHHDSIDFKNIIIYDVLPIEDDAFVGTISFDYVIKGHDLDNPDHYVEKVYTSNYQLFFVKDQGNNWKCSNLIIIDDEAANEHEQEVKDE